ncbi:hypothetical protein ACWELO_28580 [Streptomyces sp. NPDC004596]|uniref:hypothetical protein n=1 Tax=Streptomyces sp. DSM 118148 TaxID=3448667 RepID=UPI0040403E45
MGAASVSPALHRLRGLARLASTVATHSEFWPKPLAHALLARLSLASGADDDIATVIVRLDRAITATIVVTR